MALAPPIHPEIFQSCGFPLRGGGLCEQAAVFDGRCLPHTPNAVASRAEAGRKISEWRRENIHARPDAQPLRKWIAKKRSAMGFTGGGAFARACGLPRRRITDFVRGKTRFLGRAAVEAIAAYTGEGVDALISLQGGYTAESHKAELATRNLQALHQKYPKGHPVHRTRNLRGNHAALVRARSNPDVRERANHNRSMTCVRKMAEAEERPAWQRWLAARMLEKDMSREQLADALGLSVSGTNYLLETDHHSIVRKTADRLEALFGPMSPDVGASVKSANKRIRGRGGRVAQRRLKSRIEKWPRQRLEQEVKKLLSPNATPANIKDRLRKESWSGALGKPAVEIYYAAKGEVLRLARPVPTDPRQRRRPVSRSPHGQLSNLLARLERRQAARFLQCQNCGSIWQKRPKQRGMLCRPCWKPYLGQLASWRITGRIGPAPEPPRRKGGRLMAPADVQQRIIAVLRYRLGVEGPVSDEANEYRALSRTEKMLAESLHPWCQRVTRLLAQL